MRRVCVFCGSSAGSHPQYAAQMEVLGHALAEREIELVYGGGRIGLMGVIADAEGARITIAPWDYRFYAEKVRRAKMVMPEIKLTATRTTRYNHLLEITTGLEAIPMGDSPTPASESSANWPGV